MLNALHIPFLFTLLTRRSIMSKVIDKGLIKPNESNKLSSAWEIRTMTRYLKDVEESKNSNKVDNCSVYQFTVAGTKNKGGK